MEQTNAFPWVFAAKSGEIHLDCCVQNPPKSAAANGRVQHEMLRSKGLGAWQSLNFSQRRRRKKNTDSMG